MKLSKKIESRWDYKAMMDEYDSQYELARQEQDRFSPQGKIDLLHVLVAKMLSAIQTLEREVEYLQSDIRDLERKNEI